MKLLLMGSIVLLMRTGWPSAARAQERDLSCIKELAVPAYNLSARRSVKGGTVTADVTIGPGGKVSAVDVMPPDPDLGDEVRAYMRSSKYSEECAGRKVEVKFTFLLEGGPELTPPVFVRFRPPNHFVIVSRPRRAIVN